MVYVLGGWQSDFARNWAREGTDIAGAFAEALREGMAATGIEAKDIQTGHVGNFVADLFAGQGLLGGFFAQVHPDLDGLPTSRHEAACASGSIAILAATAEIEAGRYDTACVLGLELMRNVPGQTAAEHLGAAIYKDHELTDAVFPWPRAFSDLADEYDKRFGLKYEHLMRISEVNFANGKKNPNAQTRGLQFRRTQLHRRRRRPTPWSRAGRARWIAARSPTARRSCSWRRTSWAAEWARKRGRAAERACRGFRAGGIAPRRSRTRPRSGTAKAALCVPAGPARDPGSARAGRGRRSRRSTRSKPTIASR